MTRLAGCICWLLFSVFPLLAPGADPREDPGLTELQRRFVEARKAYDDDQLDQAITLYQGILKDRYYAPELFFNLANAHFRNGETGRAILNYRRASRLAPRDPDIQANLAFAVKQSGADIPEDPLLRKLTRGLDLSRWVVLTAGAWWLALLVLAGGFVLRGRRGWFRLGGFLFAVLVLTGACAVLAWWNSRRLEVVILQPNQEALFSPLENATAHFSLPEGSVAEVVSDTEDWYEIRSGSQKGWIPRGSCELVHPW